MIGLTTSFWLDALKWRAESAFAALYVIRRGDETAGAVLVKVVKPSGECVLYVPQRDETGERLWVVWKTAADEAEIDAYCERRAEDDPDLWIIAIEDREGRHFLEEPVEEV